MSFAKFIIDKWRKRHELTGLLPAVDINEGHVYSTHTQDGASMEVDWEALQENIEQLQAEFAAGAK